MKQLFYRVKRGLHGKALYTANGITHYAQRRELFTRAEVKELGIARVYLEAVEIDPANTVYLAGSRYEVEPCTNVTQKV